MNNEIDYSLNVIVYLFEAISDLLKNSFKRTIYLYLFGNSLHSEKRNDQMILSCDRRMKMQIKSIYYFFQVMYINVRRS